VIFRSTGRSNSESRAPEGFLVAGLRYGCSLNVSMLSYDTLLKGQLRSLA
jgi:hypothetical protein